MTILDEISEVIGGDYEGMIVEYIRRNPCCGRLALMTGGMGKKAGAMSEDLLDAYNWHINRALKKGIIFDRSMRRGLTGSCLVLNRARLGIDYDPEWGRK